MDNLILVGFSCSGKTTLGRNVARRLRLNFVDTDRYIEEMSGRTIPEIFREDGEAAFRALESEAIDRIMAEQNQVVSTGGGAFVNLENRAKLRTGNLVIHLQVRPETVVDRLRNSKSGRPRPLLDNPDPLERVMELMAERKEAYSAAHVTIGVDDRSRYELVGELRRRWLAWQRAHRPAAARVESASTSGRGREERAGEGGASAANAPSPPALSQR
jgi:shikimate kinase